jgi:PAS domain S-box-containing protein
MAKSIDLIQHYYEIAMSIGLTLDMNKMLKVALTSYMKNLNCTASAILHLKERSSNTFVFRRVYATPKKIQDSGVYRKILDLLSPTFNENQLNSFKKKLPLIGSGHENESYHLLDLPGFGMLLLIRPEGELSTQIIKSISPLNAKLAVACNACLQNRELKKAHKQAVDINRELRQKTLELEKSQNALSESEKKYRTIFENVQDVFYQTDLQGNILEISPSISRYTDNHRGNLVGKPVTTIYHDPMDHSRLLQALKEKNEIEDFDLRLKDKFGKQVFTSVNAHLIFDNYGNPVAIEGSMRDVTVRKHAEEALRESDRLKSDFVSSVSHELRTPLASILGFSSTILRDKKMTADVRDEFINIIYQESQRLSKLIEDILNISRIESGRVTYRMRKIDCKPIITEILEAHKIQAEGKDIEVFYKFSDERYDIFADPDALKQVVSNLFGNAVKFTPENGQIRVRLLNKVKKVSLEISDTGIGIPDKEKLKVFEKFYRVYRPGLETKGTGLGLSIVKEILDAHKAEIEIESEENKGTTFRVNFLTENLELKGEQETNNIIG